RSEGPFVFCIDSHGRGNPSGNEWFMTSMSAKRPFAIVVPTNPTAGVAKTFATYVVAPTTAAPMMRTHISFCRIPPSCVDRPSCEWLADDRSPGSDDQAALRSVVAVHWFTVECRRLPRCHCGTRITFPTHTGRPEGRHDRTSFARLPASHECGRRSAGFVEGNRGVPQARRHDGPALGKTRGDAGASASSRQDGVGLRAAIRAGRLGAQPQWGRWCGRDLGDIAIDVLYAKAVDILVRNGRARVAGGRSDHQALERNR